MKQNQITLMLQKYLREMEIIKLRTHIVMNVKFGDIQPTVELKALHLRKIIEQILLSSLITNSSKYQEYYGRLGKEWNARLIAKDLERINPDFFPKPLVNDVQNKRLIDKEDTIDCKGIIDIYEKLSKFLHSENPFSEKLNYNDAETYIKKSMKDIINLLNCHKIKPYGEKGFAYVVMKNKANGKAVANWFEPVS